MRCEHRAVKAGENFFVSFVTDEEFQWGECRSCTALMRRSRPRHGKHGPDDGWSEWVDAIARELKLRGCEAP
jgi:hypothetical protein